MNDLLKFVSLATNQPLPVEIWLAVPGCLISGTLATREEYLSHMANPFSDGEGVQEDEGLWLHDVVLVSGGKMVHVPFATVDVGKVAAWGVGFVD